MEYTSLIFYCHQARRAALPAASARRFTDFQSQEEKKNKKKKKEVKAKKKEENSPVA